MSTMSSDWERLRRILYPADAVDYTAPTIRFSLHTNGPPKPVDPSGPARLFLMDGDGEVHECHTIGPGNVMFSVPETTIARSWEIQDMHGNTVAKGTFREGA
jgi:hypothetical protein